MGLTAVLAAAGIGLQTAGQIQAGRVAAAEAKAQGRMAEYNAAVAEQQARATEQKTAFDQRREVAAGRRRLGTLIARMGASGAELKDELIAEQAAENELAMLLIGYEGATEAARARSQAGLYGMEAQYARMRGKAGRTAGYLGAGSTLLTGFATGRQEGWW